MNISNTACMHSALCETVCMHTPPPPLSLTSLLKAYLTTHSFLLPLTLGSHPPHLADGV